MRSMSLTKAGAGLLEQYERQTPSPEAGQVLVRILACGVCRTDLHVVAGELAPPRFPITPGHEIVGTVAALGSGVTDFAVGDRVGVPWLGWTCGDCYWCRSGRENLCRRAQFTGYDIDGGYAEYTVADARYVFRLPERYADAEVAPLLCAGLIGYRSYRMAGDARRLGMYGFGAAAHIIAQVATHQGREVFAFTAPGDLAGQAFARTCGAVWAGGSDQAPPIDLDAAIIFAPVGPLVPEALSRIVPGGTVVCGGIHMSDIPAFPYRLLWEERVVRSVANLTRQDAKEFLALAGTLPIRTSTVPYALSDANQALADLGRGRIKGAGVLIP